MHRLDMKRTTKVLHIIFLFNFFFNISWLPIYLLCVYTSWIIHCVWFLCSQKPNAFESEIGSRVCVCVQCKLCFFFYQNTLSSRLDAVLNWYKALRLGQVGHNFFFANCFISPTVNVQCMQSIVLYILKLH